MVIQELTINIRNEKKIKLNFYVLFCLQYKTVLLFYVVSLNDILRFLLNVMFHIFRFNYALTNSNLSFLFFFCKVCNICKSHSMLKTLYEL